MASIETKAVKMTDGEVSFISLVDHAATRAPFKRIKQEQPMGKFYTELDLGRLFTKKAERPVAIVGIIVKKSDDVDEVKARLVTAGFVTDTQEEVEGAVLFQQEEVEEDDTRESVTIRLNDELALVTKGFRPYSMEVGDGSFSDQCAAQGFYPGVRAMTEILAGTIMTVVDKAEAPAEAVKEVVKLMEEAKTYVNTISS